MTDRCCMCALPVWLQMNIDVAIVTAAGYPGDASKFEGRLQGLLKAFERHKLPPSITNRCAAAAAAATQAAANCPGAHTLTQKAQPQP